MTSRAVHLFTHAARQGWRTLGRDLRAGELRLILLAVTLAVAALTAVGFLADRFQSGLKRDARQLLGGDVVLASDLPAPIEFLNQAQALGLQLSATLTFPTMARATDAQGGGSKLVALKAVESGYPLRGRLSVADAPGQQGEPAQGIPDPGTVWVDASLLEALALKSGDKLLLGASSLEIARVIVLEPDRGAGFINFAPRVMLRSSDVAATGLVQPASRVTYRLAAAGADRDVARFTRWADEQIKSRQLRGIRVESLDSGRPEMSQTLERAEKFLNLVALLAAMLSAVAVALAARGFASRHLDDCAMLRVLGLGQAAIAWSYAIEFALVGLAASVLGVALGFGVHLVMVGLLAGVVQTSLPAASVWPVLLGLGSGFTLLLAFGLPPVLQLAQVPALRVLRRELGELKPVTLAVLALGVCGFAALLLVVGRDLKLGLIAVGGFAVAICLFALLGWLGVLALRRLVNENTAPRWLVLATRQLAAYPGYAVVQISGLAVGLLALVLLVLLRTDLIAGWKQSTPADAPNRFVINVQPEQSGPFQLALKSAGIALYDWYPMIRGRLVAINGRAIGPQDYIEDRARRLVDREFNLSFDAQLPEHNALVAGQWVEEQAGTVSMEVGIAKTLGLKLGDSLRFDIAGQLQEVRITSLRQVNWGSMRANFFALFPVSRLEGVPVTWMSAFRAPAQPGFDAALVRQFPNITTVDMGTTLAQVQRVLDQVVRAVELLFAFTLVAGLTVLLAAVGATREERVRDYAVMRAVGARTDLLRQVQRAEMVGVGLMAGILASAAASAVGWALARWVFGFDWSLSLVVPVAGALAGALLALLGGWWSLREVLRRPVVETLRRAAQ
ncbi:MAG: ABC transporter permease [Hylemonella sp.]